MTSKAISEFKGLQIRAIEASYLERYSELLSQSFKNFRPTKSYLNWLYFENPRGNVIGYDAFDGEILVAHYACVPIKIQGYESNSLLSLNTATLPSYQGRGIFGELASQTFRDAYPKFANVIGVANAKSKGGFIKHLGFEKLGTLELRLGNLKREFHGSRIYSKKDLEWRSECPGRPLSVKSIGNGLQLISVKPFKFAPKIQAIVYESEPVNFGKHRIRLGITLDWNKEVNPKFRLPKRFKPSPLELIFKPLREPDPTLISSFSFPDFDAF